jgi:hypothetical protein
VRRANTPSYPGDRVLGRENLYLDDGIWCIHLAQELLVARNCYERYHVTSDALVRGLTVEPLLFGFLYYSDLVSVYYGQC